MLSSRSLIVCVAQESTSEAQKRAARCPSLYICGGNKIILYCTCSKVDFRRPKYNIISWPCQIFVAWWLRPNFLPRFLQVPQVCQLVCNVKMLPSRPSCSSCRIVRYEIGESAGDVEEDSILVPKRSRFERVQFPAGPDQSEYNWVCDSAVLSNL